MCAKSLLAERLKARRDYFGPKKAKKRLGWKRNWLGRKRKHRRRSSEKRGNADTGAAMKELANNKES